MITTITYVALGVAVLLAAIFLLFTAYVIVFYSGYIVRVFKEMPFLLAEKVPPIEGALSITLTTRSGRRVESSLFRRKVEAGRGTILFLHEYGANRWLAASYVGTLAEHGYDILAIDFCSSGESEAIAGYEPLQWPTEYEAEDAEAGIDYLVGHVDLSKQPLILFGVSKGGGVALVTAGRRPEVHAVITDGAFPVYGTAVFYSMKWIEIFSKSRFIYEYLPRWFYGMIVRTALRRIQREKNVQYLDVERGVKQIAGRPLFMIHGKRDNYIKREIVEILFEQAPGPKELWMVPGAKHNGALEKEGEEYHRRVRAFLEETLSART